MSPRNSIAIALVTAVGALGQTLIPAPGTVDPIMGFETAAGWTVRSTSPLTTVATAAVRTQGNFAFALGNPSSQTTMASAAVSSASPAMAAIGDAGAVFAVDVMPPPAAAGSFELAITSPSLGIKNEILGRAELNALRPGIYNTVKFPIAASVRSALDGASFRDLSFTLALSWTPSAFSQTATRFLFDNLRVYSAPPVTAKIGVVAPANFGGSVSLAATGDTPATQTFAIGAVQVPDSFRLVQGTNNGTTAKLALGHDGTPAFTCSYQPDPSDESGQTYKFESCTGGATAGDLVGVNSAQLSIAGGTGPMKIQAQLARNPIGDLVGSGIIPAMPTFWGHSDGCTPLPSAGVVVTTTDPCQKQVAEANQIVTDYFKKIQEMPNPPAWVVTPAADRALRHGTALDTSEAPAVATQTGNYPFNKQGHANQGGDFDAYWILTGDLNTQANSNTGNSVAHFDAEFSGHVVVLGQDVNVASVNATVDTTSGSSSSSKGSAEIYVFGQEVPGSGSVNATTGFNFNVAQSMDFDVADLQFWIFSVKVGATASATFKASGSLAASGFSLSLAPEVSMGAHILGGVDLGIASGGVDARINLLDVTAPVKAQAGILVLPDPHNCSITIDFSADAQVTVKAVGGEIDLVATFGVCPFCDTETYTLLKWDPIESTTQTLFNVDPTTLAAIPLPVSMCVQPLGLSITDPPATIQTGTSYPLLATVTTTGAAPVECAGLTWTVTPAEPITSSGGCQTSIQFNTTGFHTLSLSGTENIVDQFGRQIPETGTAAKTVSVATLANGPYIIGISGVVTNGPLNNRTIGVKLTRFTETFQLTGEYIGSATAVNLTWTATDFAGHTTTLHPVSCGACGNLPNSQQTVSWEVVQVGGIDTVKMTATDASGNVLGTASMKVDFTL